MNFPENLSSKLTQRENGNALRILGGTIDKIDFSSNDYLGFAASGEIFNQTHQYLLESKINHNGATGSRLISGNHRLYQEAETLISKFHQSESALIFNSGYDANLGFFSCVPQRSDLILFDELSHASIRDGIRLCQAKSLKFAHNDLEELESLILQHKETFANIYIATESVFSMDGDSPNLENLVVLSEKHSAFLVIDEAHALGVFGKKGEGLIGDLNLQSRVFARIVTFGKGLGCHGAAILGSKELTSYLVNFARSFIYTTGLPPHSVATILTAYRHLDADNPALEKLRDNILHFNHEINSLGLKQLFVGGKSAIKSAIIPGNDNVKRIAAHLQEKGFGIKAILSPTVPQGQERLRICLHSYNTQESITSLLKSIQEVVVGV